MITTPCKVSAIKDIKRRRRNTSMRKESSQEERCKGRNEDKGKENDKKIN